MDRYETLRHQNFQRTDEHVETFASFKQQFVARAI